MTAGDRPARPDVPAGGAQGRPAGAGALSLTAPGDSLTVRVGLVPAREAPVAAWAAEMATPEDLRAVGPDMEPKYRICSLARPDAGSLRVTVAETTWRAAASFHRALRRTPPAAPQRDRLVRALIDETKWFPGLAGVHCVLFAAGRIPVAVRRSSRVAYSPGLWSTTYEEQLTATDLHSEREDPFSAAARRGYAEEFGLPAGALRIRIIGAAAETEILNRVLLAAVETDHTLETLREAGAGLDEIGEIRLLTGTPEELDVEARRADFHPTAALRLRLAGALRN